MVCCAFASCAQTLNCAATSGSPWNLWDVGVPANVQIDTVADACAICLDENQRHVKWIFGECGHSFCIKCSRTLYGLEDTEDADVTKECPLCRGTAPLWYEPGGAGVRPLPT